MLKSLHIENYRLFKQLDVPKLGRVNLITGKNNVGKTALLEAIRICVSGGETSVINNIILDRGDWGNKDYREDYATLFYNHKTEGEKIVINDFSFEFSATNKDRATITSKKYSTTDMYLNGNNIGVLRDKATVITTKIDQNNNHLWEDIALTDKEDLVIEMLRIIEPKLMQIAVDTSGDATRVRLKHSRKPIPLKNLGDGIKRLLAIAIGLVSAENSYLLIDEFDIGLHYSVQEQLWGIIFRISKELNVQVFATTHSKECIEAFTEVALKHEEEELQYFRLQRKRNSEDIISVEYTTRNLEVALLSNFEMR